MTADAPPRRPDGAREIPSGAQLAGGVDLERQLRQRPAGGTEQDLAAARRVEGGVVTRTDERRPGLHRRERGFAIERNRAAGVRTDLRVGDDPAGGPAATSCREVEAAPARGARRSKAPPSAHGRRARGTRCRRSPLRRRPRARAVPPRRRGARRAARASCRGTRRRTPGRVRAAGVINAAPRAVPAPAPARISSRLRVKRSPLSATTCSISASSSG